MHEDECWIALTIARNRAWCAPATLWSYTRCCFSGGIYLWCSCEIFWNRFSHGKVENGESRIRQHNKLMFNRN